MDEKILLSQVIAAVRAGQKAKARRLLQEGLAYNPRNDKYWLYLSSLMDQDDQRIACLQRVLRIDPENQNARRELNKLEVKATATLATPESGVENQVSEPSAEPQTVPCPFCGKIIRDISVFCMFCGKAILDKEPESSHNGSTAETHPIAIEELEFNLKGPTEVKKGFFGRGLVGRGFEVWICLSDDSGRPTASDGQFFIAIIRLKSILDHTPLGTSEQAIRQAQRNSFFFNEMDVLKSDFKWVEVHRFHGKSEELRYTYRHMSPLVFARTDGSIFVHSWFRTPEGKSFYKTHWVGSWE